MACDSREVASWVPDAVAATLRADTAQPLIAWLSTLRASIEEYDPLIVVRPPSPELEDTETPDSPDSAFDEILSQLGKEIFKLDQYQQHLVPNDKEVSLSILNIFDECLGQMGEKTNMTAPVNGECPDGDTALFNEPFATSTPECVKASKMKEEVSEMTEEVSEITEEVSKQAEKEVFLREVSEMNGDLQRTRLKTSSSSSSLYDNVETLHDSQEWSKLIESESDSESTCWSYKECSDAEHDVNNTYAAVWIHSSGFHNSDAILRRVLSQNKATVSRISRLSYDTVETLEPPEYTVYALHEVGDADRCAGAGGPVAAMTPERPCDDAGYEPVRDALSDDNIYEEIEYGYSYTDEGCSCGTSVEVESCSVSASSEGVGRESPLYVNLRDHDAYAVTPDVIYWKDLLQDPFYCDDEEDEWITPEECAVYSREQRPPLVIPRITPYRTARRAHHPYPEEAPLKSSMRDYGRMDYSPISARVDLERSFSKASSDSPPFGRLHQKHSGSTENILGVLPRRPQHLQLPASSSGDSLDIEIRGDLTKTRHGRKSQSVHVGHKHRMQRSPVPAPRSMMPPPRQLPETTFQVIHEGTVKRTKYIENGKKSKKNWTECYMILTPTALMFYKDQKTYQAFRQSKPGTPPSPSGPRLELVLPLLNARVLQCKPMHTRRHNKSLWLTVDYDEYLIQDDTEKGNEKWLHEIQKVIYKLYPLLMNMEHPSLHPQSSNTDLESLGRTPPASRHANSRNKHKVGGSSNEDLSDSTENSIQKSHVKRRLRDFFARRPAMEVLMKKGYYKDEPVFGRNLEEVCAASSPRVPEFVVACVKEIESSEENMCTDGLYRASGNLSQVQKLRLDIDQTSKNHMEVIRNNTDIHVLTGSLKLFFRELKEPLIPCSIFDRILAACSLKPKEVKIKEFRDIINSLPQCNRDTLKYLLEHLLRVTKYSERNRMHTANLAIVFGPTLLWAPAAQAHNIAVDCIQQNNVVDILLNEFNDIFIEDNTKGKKKA